MSGQQFPNAVEVDILTWLLSGTGWAAGNTALLLFTNDFEAGKTEAQKDAATNASFTGATFPGSAAVTLTSASWVITGGQPTAAVYPIQTFERSSTGASETVYGYWIRRVSDSRLLTYEQFPGPVVVTNNGQRIRFTPRLPCRSWADVA